MKDILMRNKKNISMCPKGSNSCASYFSTFSKHI